MYELNGGNICLITSGPDMIEGRQGRLFCGSVGRILDDALLEAGIRRSKINILSVVRQPVYRFEYHKQDLIDRSVIELKQKLRELQPQVIVTLGPQAAHAVIPDWPDGRDRSGLVHRGNIKRAIDLENRRGYVFDSEFGPVVATVHPRDVEKTWSPWRVLLSHDLQKARRIAENGLVRPTRDVNIVGSNRDARRALERLRRFRVVGADIETWADTSLACIGFAGESGEAHVFPAEYLDRAAELLRDPLLTTVWANGIYDLFVLKHRCGVDFQARVDDAQIAWHAAYPELAGQKEDRRKHRFTRKSLSFLASLTTNDYWWKGDYETDEEFFIYNGKDCCITYDVWNYVMQEVKSVGAEKIYEHERGLMWPCVDMLARGLYVDDEVRQERIDALTEDIDRVSADALAEVVPLLEREEELLRDMKVLHMFQETDPTCPCCGHGKRKQMACWACAGFSKAPSKAEMLKRFRLPPDLKVSKGSLEKNLPICHVCGGAPRETRWSFNANSDTQMKILLYDVLKLPRRLKRNNKGKSVLTVDEKALKGLLGGLQDGE